MKESYCIVDKRVFTRKIKEGVLNSFVDAQFAELKKSDM